MARTLCGGRDKQLGARDDLEAGRMMLADPGLVIVHPVEMDQEIHVTFEREKRILGERMKGSKEDAGLQESVVGIVVHGLGLAYHVAPSRRHTDDVVQAVRELCHTMFPSLYS